MTLPQSPADVRIAVNGTHIAYLVVNGPISIRNREQIEQIVRILNRRGMDEGSPIAVAIIVRDNGAIVETDANDIDFTDGILVEYISPNVIKVRIPPDGVETAMIQNAAVTGAKLANGAVTTGKLADNAVTPAKLDRAYSQPGHTHPVVANQTLQTVPAGTFSTSGAIHQFTFDLDDSTAYRVYGLALIRADGGAGTTANGSLRLQALVGGTWGNGLSVPFQFDQGVDSTGFAMLYVGNPGDTQYRLYWTHESGTLNVKGGSILLMAIPTSI